MINEPSVTENERRRCWLASIEYETTIKLQLYTNAVTNKTHYYTYAHGWMDMHTVQRSQAIQNTHIYTGEQADWITGFIQFIVQLKHHLSFS